MTTRTLLLPILVAALGLTACGGGDDDASGADAGSATSTEQPTAAQPSSDEEPRAAQPSTAEQSSVDEPSDTPGDLSDAAVTASDDGSDADGQAVGGGDVTCDRMFSTDEIESWFGEPVDLTEDTNDQLGQLICTWETIEDPDDSTDLAFGVITAQFFSGDPIPAANFVDPDVFDEVTMLDGIGDLAFYEDSFGRNFYFVDGDVAGSLSLSEADLGNPGAEPSHSADEAEQLFREFHDRVTS